MASPNPKKYRAQVVVVDALQYDGSNRDQLNEWTGGKIISLPDGGIGLQGAEGFPPIPVAVTDWVLHDPWGNWLVCNDHDFQIAYAPGPN